VPVPQKLPQIPILPVRYPDLREAIFQHQPQNQLRILTTLRSSRNGDCNTARKRKVLIATNAVLRAIPALPSEWLISGLVYDEASGLVEIVVPTAPIR
jgi:hypothetical protein